MGHNGVALHRDLVMGKRLDTAKSHLDCDYASNKTKQRLSDKARWDGCMRGRNLRFVRCSSLHRMSSHRGISWSSEERRQSGWSSKASIVSTNGTVNPQNGGTTNCRADHSPALGNKERRSASLSPKPKSSTLKYQRL